MIFNDERSRAGSARITRRLRNNGWMVGKNRVAKLMKTAGIQSKAAKKYKATTNSNHYGFRCFGDCRECL